MADTSQIDIDKEIRERFMALPKPVQDAITSADLTKHLQALASTHKLHVDQWQKLENEVLYTILGIQEVTSLSGEMQKTLGLSAEDAAKLATDINTEIFEPIRKELERELDHPAAEAKVVSDIEAARAGILGTKPAAEQASGQVSSLELLASSKIPKSVAPVAPAPAVAPATPPTPPPETKAVRAPISSSYTSQTASHERKGIEGDPYREQVA